MVTVERGEPCIDLVWREDGALDDWIGALLPEEFEHLLERLVDLRDGIDLPSVLGW